MGAGSELKIYIIWNQWDKVINAYYSSYKKGIFKRSLINGKGRVQKKWLQLMRQPHLKALGDLS